MLWRMTRTPPVIAVLDDEPQMRKALRRLLVVHGFRVEAYERGNDFLAALSSHPADCLVLDLHMPEVNGFDVLAAFESQRVVTPVVVITGHDEPGTAERALSLGASAYLTKPVGESALLSAIKSAIAANGALDGAALREKSADRIADKPARKEEA
jgi:FixJ family two-component response regulator